MPEVLKEPEATAAPHPVGHQLRAMYDDVVRQGVPDRFAELIRKLDGPEAAAAQIDDPAKNDGSD